jgi:hypothetical protein
MESKSDLKLLLGSIFFTFFLILTFVPSGVVWESIGISGSLVSLLLGFRSA